MRPLRARRRRWPRTAAASTDRARGAGSQARGGAHQSRCSTRTRRARRRGRTDWQGTPEAHTWRDARAKE